MAHIYGPAAESGMPNDFEAAESLPYPGVCSNMQHRAAKHTLPAQSMAEELAEA